MTEVHMLKKIIVLAAIASLTSAAHAAFKVPGYELVYSYPVETTLAEPDMRLAQDVWPEMIDQAKKTLDVNQFYVTPSNGEPLEPTLAAMDRAAKRGVKIRVILEHKFEKNSLDGIARLKTMPGLQLKIADWQLISGNGIIHAKYFIVDSTRAYVGSQNFDWRSMKHVHEMGLAIDDAPVVKQVEAVFNHDWAIADSTSLVSGGIKLPVADDSGRGYLVASPWRQNPDGVVGDSENELRRLIAAAKDEIIVQNLEYWPTSHGNPSHYYGAIDTALRDASARGVKIKILISHWGTEEPAVKGLQSLAVLPGVEARVITIPEASTGSIPFARVTHSKYAVFDGKTLWIGTSNWAGGYLDQSRNLEVVVKDEKLAARAAAVQKHLWDSSYTVPLEVLKTYPKPRH
ncbi:MAG: phosphatidylserine/phosphatidylglycerophosphate/cardiolipin synthase family protein [Elusimicrobiota bacterium]